jgi:hypothetical protein
MRKYLVAVLLAVSSVLSLGGCGSTASSMTAEDRSQLHNLAQSAIADFKKADPDIDKFFKSAYAYAIFPNVNAGAVLVGGAYGHGEVYQGGKMAGLADVSKANVGAQLGGQSYEQLVFFESAGSYAQFTGGTFEMDANASAVAAAKGASTSANYQKGVLVFTNSLSGLMVQASVGGQKFRFTPMNP